MRRRLLRLQALTALVAIAALLWSTGCASWHRVELPDDTTLARRRQVQIWRSGAATVVHAVRVTPDTVSGVPYLQPPSCDSCAIVIPRSQVDSMRLGDAEGAVLGGSIVFFAVLALLYWGLRPGCCD